MFHKGNTVKIKEDFGPKNYDSYYIRPNKDGGMYKYAGKEVEIKEVIKNFSKDKPGYKLTGEDGIDVWTWSEDMFEDKPISKFKVGDKVRIKEIKEPGANYKYCFTEAMAKKSGQICTIAEIPRYTPCITEYKVPDDGYTYKLKEDDDRFNWTSGMLEKVSDTISEYPKYECGTTITFRYKDKFWKYRVEHPDTYRWFLAHKYACDFDKILELIGIDCSSIASKSQFIEETSDCKTEPGNFPYVICEDSSGIAKVIAAINKRLDKINAEWEKSNTYKEDDPIVFKLHTEQLNYKVHRLGDLWWLYSPDHRNDILLEKIGLLSKEDQYDFVKQNSGCHIICMPGFGAFPEIICDDETGINKVIHAIFKKIEETTHSVCTEGPQDISDGIGIKEIGKITISPNLKVISSVDLVCDSTSDYCTYHCVPETPEPMSLYDRIKTPEKAEYKLNFKN